MGLLTELISRNAWEALFECLSSEQRRLIAELFMTDRLGRTPLHYACAKKQAPQHVVALMLHYYGTKWFASQDIGGNTPLHAAAANGNALVVELLMENLHSRRLQYVNGVGSTPLLLAWKKFLNPTSRLFGHVNVVGRPCPQNLHLLTNVQDVIQLNQDAEYRNLQDVWTKTTVLVAHAASNKKGSAMMARPLHDMLTVGGKRHVQCPTVAFWLALRLYSHHLHLTDEHGNLPIHLAAKHSDLSIIPMAPSSLDHGDTNQVWNANESALTQLAYAWPKGAITPTRSEGRLAIFLAIEAGKSFDGGICALVHAAPQTLEQRDVKTKLPPFLVAATCCKASLTAVWELVRARPDLLVSGKATTLSPDRKRSTLACNDEFSSKKAKVMER